MPVLLLFVLFIGIPILEIMAINQVQSFLGWPATILILVLDSIAGAYLVRLQGGLAWKRFTEALQGGRLPAEEVVDGALILFGGALLLTPGFLTDIAGLSMVFTPSRKLLNSVVRARFTLIPTSLGAASMFGRRPSVDRDPSATDPPTRPRKPRRPGVIDVEVVDVRRTTDDRGTDGRGTNGRGTDEPDGDTSGPTRG